MLLYTPDKVEAVLHAADRFDREEMGPKEFMIAGLIGAPEGIVSRATSEVAIHSLGAYSRWSTSFCFPMGQVKTAGASTGLSTNSVGPGSRLLNANLQAHSTRVPRTRLIAGPVKDNTGSKPYIQLNRLLDDAQAHGSNEYMCAANQVVTLSDCIMPVYEHFCKMIDEMPEFQSSMLAFEFIPNDVVRSRPDDATAYNCRDHSNKALIIVKWNKDNENELRDTARAYARGMRKLIDPGEGEGQVPYGNYGA